MVLENKYGIIKAIYGDVLIIRALLGPVEHAITDAQTARKASLGDIVRFNVQHSNVIIVSHKE